MKKIYAAVSAVALAAMLTAAGPSTPAKADGGAVFIGVGAYLFVDALIGRHCRVNEWPFNLVRAVGEGIHGRDSCRGYPHHRHRYR